MLLDLSEDPQLQKKQHEEVSIMGGGIDCRLEKKPLIGNCKQLKYSQRPDYSRLFIALMKL